MASGVSDFSFFDCIIILSLISVIDCIQHSGEISIFHTKCNFFIQQHDIFVGF